MALAMLKGAKSHVGQTAWPYAIRHAMLIKNLTPHSTLPDGSSPYILWTGNKPSLSTVHTFSCKATIAIPEKQHDKLLSHSITGIHLDLAIGKKAFVVYDPNMHKVLESCDVHFFEGGSESECVTIKIPDVDSPLHVKAKPIGIEVECDIGGDNDGKDVGGMGEEKDDVDIGGEEMSGQVPKVPCQS